MIYNDNERTITTQRLILRPYTTQDAEPLAAICDNYNVYKSTLNLPHPYTKQCALDWISTHKQQFDEDKQYVFAITDKQTGVLYGSMGLSHNQKHNNGEVGYMIDEKQWGKGYATEALKAVIEFAFAYKGYHKVFARHLIDNPASGRVMQKSGMAQEGIFKDHMIKDGRYIDIVNYGIVNNENK